jgi:hypothetical protein
MKLLMYNSNGYPHIKNYDNLQRMCQSCNIDFEFTNSIERAHISNYDILILNDKFYHPSQFSPSIKIIYGPQLWVIPEGPIIGPLDESLVGRCAYNSLSKWIENYVLTMAGSLIMPIGQFPFSVETSYFKPSESPVEKNLDCIVYIKNRLQSTIQAALEIVNKKQLKYKIFKYGSYNQQDYIACLHQSKFMLTLDAHESQGFALQEAMSMNVPLLAVNAQSFYDESTDGISSTYEHLKPRNIPASSVPYWSEECGILVKEPYELDKAIDIMMSEYTKFTPRKFIERELSAEVCMKRILDYFKLSTPSQS